MQQVHIASADVTVPTLGGAYTDRAAAEAQAATEARAESAAEAREEPGRDNPETTIRDESVGRTVDIEA